MIDRAKGILMRARGIGEDEAYGMLRKAVMDQDRKLADIGPRPSLIQRKDFRRDQSGALNYSAGRCCKCEIARCRRDS